MAEEKVHIETIAAFKAVGFSGFGTTPEDQAWKALEAWAKPKGWLDDGVHRIFGFDNPEPSPGSPNYGYEFWLVLLPDDTVEDGLKVKDFSGGMYAVLRVDAVDPYKDIPAAWQALVKWQQGSKYTIGRHQCLEGHVSETRPPAVFSLDLYLPISE